MKVGILIQARAGSSRLPGKVLLPFGTGSVLDHVLARCSEANCPDVIAVATTDQPGDDFIARACEHWGIAAIRGSEHDVLDRYRLAIERLGIDLVIRVTADCPFVWHEDIDRVAAAIIQAGAAADYATNAGCPDGLSVEAAWALKLLQTADTATDPYDREHVMPSLYRHQGRHVLHVEPSGGHHGPRARLALDTLTDYGLLTALWSRADTLGVEASPEWLVDAVTNTGLATWHERAIAAAGSTAGAPADVAHPDCEVCSILEALGPAACPLSGGWLLNGNVDPRVARPALVMTCQAHRRDLKDLNDAEATWLGRNLRRIDPVFCAASGAERLHVLLLNQAGHVHLHLIPRYAEDDPQQFAPQLLTVPGPPDAPTPAVMAAEVAKRLQ